MSEQVIPVDRSLSDIANNESTERNSSKITAYLTENCAEYRLLAELRKKGWQNPQGDLFFEKQRRNADNADARMSEVFYKVMREIGAEIHRITGALYISRMHYPAAVLDMCMAPGGFLAVVMEKNPEASAVAFSLPPAQGGHKPLLQISESTKLNFVDVTMLAADMGIIDIPAEHPDAKNVLPRQLDAEQRFNLALCDGQVLRTHSRPEYREHREARRLTISQLVVSLEHLKVGGTIIMLLHKVEAIDTILLLQTFSKFSNVEIFKPQRHHAKRSSFYMIASNVDSQHPEARGAIARWKQLWNVATFGSEAAYMVELNNTNVDVEKLLIEFGEELVRLGTMAWKIQARALSKAPFIR